MPPAPTAITVTVVWNVYATRYRRCWQLSSTSSNKTRRTSSLLSNLRQQFSISAATGLTPNEVHILVGSHDSLSRVSGVLESSATRAWSATTSPTVVGDGLPAARVQYRSRTPRPHCCSCEPAHLRPLRRPASSSQTRRWRLGVGVQYGGPPLPGCEARHGRQGPQGQTLTQLDGPLQSSRSWILVLSGHTGRIPSQGKAPVFGSSDIPRR